MTKISKSYTKDLILLGLLFIFVFFLFLGMPALSVPDEARYAEIPREMLQAHQFIIPHQNGVAYVEKGPLCYWLVAGFEKLFGYSEWAVRAAVATLGLLGCLVTYIFSRKIFNRRTGILSALILSSCAIYFILYRFNVVDDTLTFCLTLSLYSFLFALQSEKPHSGWLWSGYFFSGLAVLTKGLIGIFFPAGIIFIWMILAGRLALIKNMRIFSGACIIFLMNVPWLLLVQQRIPDFLNFYFIVQQFERYATPIAHREQNSLFYIGILLVSTFPWVVFLPQAIKYNLDKLKNTKAIRKNTIFLMCWPGLIALFFAFSHSILITYLLPIVPPLAILLARYGDYALSLPQSKNILARGAIILVIIDMMMGIGFSVFLYVTHAPLNMRLIAVPVVFIIAACCIFVSVKRASLKNLMCVLLVAAYATLLMCWFTVWMENPSIKSLALTINRLMKAHPNADIISLRYYHDLPYYTQQPVILVGNFYELDFGFEHDKNSKQWIIDENNFWQRWSSAERVYVVSDDAVYQQWFIDQKRKVYLIQKTGNDVLVSNQRE